MLPEFLFFFFEIKFNRISLVTIMISFVKKFRNIIVSFFHNAFLVVMSRKVIEFQRKNNVRVFKFLNATIKIFHVFAWKLMLKLKLFFNNLFGFSLVKLIFILFFFFLFFIYSHFSLKQENLIKCRNICIKASRSF